MNIFGNLCDLGKCLQISLKNIIHIFVLTFWLKCGLNQIIFLCLLCFGLDDVLLRIYFIKMLNPLSLKRKIHMVILFAQIHPHCKIN